MGSHADKSFFSNSALRYCSQKHIGSSMPTTGLLIHAMIDTFLTRMVLEHCTPRFSI